LSGIIRFLLPPLGALLLACADGLQPVPFQGIAGGVLYRGTVPDSTEWVRLGVFEQEPETVIEFLTFSAISDPLPLDADSVPYVIALETGLYRWLPVVWKQAGVPIPDGLRVLGWYNVTGEPVGDAAPFLVEPESALAGLDLIADYDNPLTLEEALEALR
jgi:hypothetical protein